MSYASTSVKLSDKNKYVYFSRTVMTDDDQAMTLTKLMTELQLPYAAAITTDDSTDSMSSLFYSRYIYIYILKCIYIQYINSSK